MSSLPEEWVPTPTEAEVPADHWSKSPEWLAYKAQQAALINSLPKTASTLAPFQQVGTITPGQRKLTTHELQMEACKVEWVDPNPPEEVPLDDFAKEIASVELHNTRLTTEQLEEIARTIVKRISKTTDAEADATPR